MWSTRGLYNFPNYKTIQQKKKKATTRLLHLGRFVPSSIYIYIYIGKKENAFKLEIYNSFRAVPVYKQTRIVKI